MNATHYSLGSRLASAPGPEPHTLWEGYSGCIAKTLAAAVSLEKLRRTLAAAIDHLIIFVVLAERADVASAVTAARVPAASSGARQLAALAVDAPALTPITLCRLVQARTVARRHVGARLSVGSLQALIAGLFLFFEASAPLSAGEKHVPVEVASVDEGAQAGLVLVRLDSRELGLCQLAGAVRVQVEVHPAG